MGTPRCWDNALSFFVKCWMDFFFGNSNNFKQINLNKKKYKKNYFELMFTIKLNAFNFQLQLIQIQLFDVLGLVGTWFSGWKDS